MMRRRIRREYELSSNRGKEKKRDLFEMERMLRSGRVEDH